MRTSLIQVGHAKWPASVTFIAASTLDGRITYTRALHHKMLSCRLQGHKRGVTTTASDPETEHARIRRQSSLTR